MGARVGDICYNTTAEAADAFYSALPYACNYYLSSTSLDRGVCVGYLKVAGVWQQHFSILNGGTAVSSTLIDANVSAQKFPACTYTPPVTNTTMFNDGMTMGWGVVGAMVAALAVIFLKQSLFK